MRAVGRLHGQVGPGDVVDEQRVAGQHRPGLVAAGGVDEREGTVLRPVAGRGEHADDERPDAQLVPVGELRVSLGAGLRDQSRTPGDVVGVRVRLEHVLDLHADVAREAQVLVDLEARIHDRGDARVVVPDQVGGAAEVVVDDLAEDHRRDLIRSRAWSAVSAAGSVVAMNSRRTAAKRSGSSLNGK